MILGGDDVHAKTTRGVRLVQLLDVRMPEVDTTVLPFRSAMLFSPLVFLERKRVAVR